MIYYKVLRENLLSATTYTRGVEVQYKVDEWIKPQVENTKLMVFETFELAKRFCDKLCGQRYIYSCEVANPQPAPAKLCSVWSEQKYGAFWENKVNENLINLPSPQGTIICDAVKLIEQQYKWQRYVVQS